MSLPTHLQLELAASRPSPLYIHQSASNEIPYESSAVKFERLKNVLILPYYLEGVMLFGALACLDAWLHTFTILPMRFCVALGVLVRWWVYLIAKEIRWMLGFVWYGLGRLWRRGRRGRRPTRDAPSAKSDGLAAADATEDERSRSRARHAPSSGAQSRALNTPADEHVPNGVPWAAPNGRPNGGLSRNLSTASSGRAVEFRHRRTKSLPSALTSFHKADLLQGLVILASSLFLMKLDASRMYHFIRAQSALKLYVIYNLIEVRHSIG